ncbi:Aste57867_20221 [Aphanomyces stellatus]|uniref:Aste57867_20221 protein n=1 Tax=Aphanomyces stellatus TaxID=120398 RepID=A0A485LF31_9STRA|nr:hypothetical protein As57867_020155 [Aphanomyces stellatus]VFT96914.1 Aste57867_20221 [Aphanomyces stellatus]
MNVQFTRTARELTQDAKLQVVQELQTTFKNGKLAYGAMMKTASSSTASKKKGKVGSKTQYTNEQVIDIVRDVPEAQRTTMRDVIEATWPSMYILNKYLKTDAITRRSSRLKPLLTDTNSPARVIFCRSYVQGEAESSMRDRRSAPVAMLAEAATVGIGGLADCHFSGMWDIGREVV